MDTIHLWNGICDTNVSEYLRTALGTNDCFAKMNDNVLQMDNENASNNETNSSNNFANIDAHLQLLERLKLGENPNAQCQYDETKQILQEARGDRVIASATLLKHILISCKKQDQKRTIQSISSLIERYYFQEHADTQKFGHKKYDNSAHGSKLATFTWNENTQEVSPLPVVAVLGVPGAGKSWVISQIRKWCGLRIPINTQPLHSLETIMVNHIHSNDSAIDPVTMHCARFTKESEDGHMEESQF